MKYQGMFQIVDLVPEQIPNLQMQIWKQFDGEWQDVTYCFPP